MNETAKQREREQQTDFWLQLSRHDLFQSSIPCFKQSRLMSVLSSDGKRIINVRKSDGLRPSARIEW